MRVFLDTNILVYAYDSAEAKRHPIAVQLIETLLKESDDVIISPQVAGEFVNTMRRKNTPHAMLHQQLGGLSAFTMTAPTLETMGAAWTLCAAHSVAWYDAIIVQTAIEARCEKLYSEDMQHGRTFGGLEVVNAFV